MYQQLRLEPYAVHTTFQYAGTEGKRHRLREAMVFYDPPEYYDSPGTICHTLVVIHFAPMTHGCFVNAYFFWWHALLLLQWATAPMEFHLRDMFPV